jgi:hypothetical protein
MKRPAGRVDLAELVGREARPRRAPGSKRATRPQTVVSLAGPNAESPIHIQADGRRVAIEAFDELELRCGKASITLRRNGKIVIYGTQVETRSRGLNRIKGGSVKIN